MMILTKSSWCTYFIVRSIEVTHLSFPILFFAFVAGDDRETIECAWGQGSTRLSSEGYRSDWRDRRRRVNRYACAEKGETYGEDAWLVEKSVCEAMPIFRQRRPNRPPSRDRQPHLRCRSREVARLR